MTSKKGDEKKSNTRIGSGGKSGLTARICFLLNRGRGAIPHLSPTCPSAVDIPVSFSFPLPFPFPFPLPGCSEETVTAPWSARTVRPRSCANEMPCCGAFPVLDREEEDEANGAERERGAAREGGRGRAVVAVVADDEEAFGVALRGEYGCEHRCCSS